MCRTGPYAEPAWPGPRLDDGSAANAGWQDQHPGKYRPPWTPSRITVSRLANNRLAPPSVLCLLRFLLLRRQRLAEGAFLLCHVFSVPLGIHERVGLPLLELLVPIDHAVVAAVRPQEHVARQALEHLERSREILRDPQVLLVADELVARVDIRAADDDDVVFLPPIGDLPGPRRATARVAWRQSCHQRDAAELDLFLVFEDAIDLARRPAVGRVLVLPLAARCDHVVVAAH